MELLTSLAAVKEWLGIDADNTDSDVELLRLVRAASAYASSYMSRPSFAAHDVIENNSGNGSNQMLLREWPVISVSSVGIAGRAIDASVEGNAGLYSHGFRLSDLRSGTSAQSIDLIGSTFWYRSQAQVAYRAGYEATDEYVIETYELGDPPVTTIVPYPCGLMGFWVKDFGVTIDGLAAMVTTELLPATGTYRVTASGEYIFSIDDEGKTALISYGYVPWDISEAVLELVAEASRSKDHIGVKSKSLAGQETISYFDSIMTPIITSIFNQYRNVVPY